MWVHMNHMLPETYDVWHCDQPKRKIWNPTTTWTYTRQIDWLTYGQPGHTPKDKSDTAKAKAAKAKGEAKAAAVQKKAKAQATAEAKAAAAKKATPSLKRKETEDMMVMHHF